VPARRDGICVAIAFAVAARAPLGKCRDMSKAAKPIPDGYSVLSPYLSIRGAARAIDFYKQAFGAKERMRLEMPGGQIGHAELELGDTVLMLADELPEMGFHGPEKYGGVSMVLHLYVEDADAVVARAESLGAKIMRAVANQFYGDRSGMVTDPFGYSWNIATHVEDLTNEEIQQRAAAAKG
jgi:PhnB protein